MKVLGIDPGLHKTGWCIVSSEGAQKVKHLASGLIITNTDSTIDERLLYIHDDLSDVIAEHKPDRAAIEKTYVNKNYGSSLKLAHARAASILTCGIANLDLEHISSKHVKKSVVGNGNASKEQVAYMVQILLGPHFVSESQDITDAAAIAITRIFRTGTAAHALLS